MTPTISTALEHALQRHGDDLYRLALLLTSDEAHAAAALRNAIPRLIDTPPAALEEPAMIAALVAALPAERRRLRRQRPAWARLPAEREEAPLVAALAQLPRQQRLALGLMLLRGFDAAQAASTLIAGEADVRVQARDALLALAPHVRPGLAPDDLAADSALEDCRPTRVALALGGDLAHADPAARGHLALCSACRAAEQAWQRLTTTVENALRGALRDITLPEYLAYELRAMIARTPGQPRRSLLADQRGRLVLVALAVVAVIALLVLPGRRAPSVVSTGAVASAPAVLAPRVLVERALGQLYAPPAGAGVWHGSWEIRWSFVGGSYATLNAEAWVDTDSSRHRVQLVHASGGGPFEFELADAAGNLWYATTPSYAPSLYPSLLDRNALRTRLQITPDAARRMLRARLASGAWDLAGAYLRQAQAARELRSWGRQRSPDGATLEIISFDGFSPLAPPPDTPDAANVPTTILLAIDAQSGALYEVRELTGPEGGERTSRTSWRFVAGEWLTATQDVERAFDQRRAWNGIGDFGEPRASYADPALPLVPSEQVMSLASALQQNPALWLPATPPPGAERALLLASDDGASLWTVYLGAGRLLVIHTIVGKDGAEVVLDPASGEAITLAGQQIVLRPTSGLGYQARLTYRGQFNEQLQTAVSAIGYTRAELVDLLRGFGPPTAEAYRAQASLFADPQTHDPAAFEALLGALAAPPPPQPGAARHFVERTFTRHSPAPDPFPDPYHLRLYGGRPEQLLVENWVRVAGDGIESTATERDSSGTIYGRQYLGPETVWYYDAPGQLARQMPRRDLALINRINLDQGIVLEMLARGGSRLVTLPDGTRAISNSQQLVDTRFFSQLSQQQSDPGAGGPYVADLYIDTTLTTLVFLGADGRPQRIETWASGAPSATNSAPEHDRVLLETWELLSDEQIPANRIPAGTFDAKPPETLTFQDDKATSFPSQPNIVLAPLPITDALRLVQAPLFVLAPTPTIDAPLVEAGDLANRHMNIPDNDIFLAALDRGLAIRLTYWLPTGGPLKRQTYIYEGDAKTFGAYLRTQSAWRWGWQSSQPFRTTIGERTIDGWKIGESGGAAWTLLEVDGTLLAVQTIYDEQAAALTQLQPFGRP